MARLTDAILQNNQAFAAGRQNPMIDLSKGGQMGFAPDYTQWVSNQSYIRRNLFCLLVEAPRGFNFLQNGDKYVGVLKSLVELHALSIDGLNAGLEVETSETPVGGGGQVQQHFTNVTEARSNPVFRFDEKYGMPVASFFRSWITHLMMDPHSKVANIGTLSGNKPTDMLADMYSATMLFIEPDPTHTKVVKSWLCTNMFPTGTGEIVGRRDLTQAGEQTTYDITFTALSQFGLGVDQFAQQMLDGINITGANPYLRPAFIDQIAADVRAAANGYEQQVESLGSSSLRV